MNHTITTEMISLDSRNRGWQAVCTCGWAGSSVYLEDVLAAHDLGYLNDSAQDHPPEQHGGNKSDGKRNITFVPRG